jgi:Meiotically up-regulated gene 113
MPRKSLKYVNTYVDRSGNVRAYLRKPGQPRIPIFGIPGSKVFMGNYKALMAPPPKVPKVPKVKIQPRPIGQIYYLSDGEHIKIGFTMDWSKRKYAYTTYSPRDLKLLATHPGTKGDEKMLHRTFKPHRVKNEWYRQSEELMDHIKRTVGELNTD